MSAEGPMIIDPNYATNRVEKAHERIDALDQRVTVIERENAVSAERMTGISSSLSEIKSGVTWINRLVIGAILAGIITFMIKGGFGG